MRSGTCFIKLSQGVALTLSRPVIEEANRAAPAYSRIFKELILITRKGKPLPRTEKNTVMRKLALEVYGADIEKMYVSIFNDLD